MLTALTPLELQLECAKLQNWKIKNDKWIERKYMFKEYMQGIQFVSAIGQIAEENQHHPFINVQYKAVIVSLSSWAAKGVTAIDIDLAVEFEKAYEHVNHTISSIR
ncbi:4a-hydroxytetrahydrobiopterin dehydratase [Neobacillus sp. NPDC097160]|uniref:4a-hydroxytetrahydrobiopterin dehydratase n=1 Tax=Neobacillus sp. NPDC097160 TaxID=3364298 RepID=UPI00380A007D